jgi:DNA polymerase III subunit epsilon
MRAAVITRAPGDYGVVPDYGAVPLARLGFAVIDLETTGWSPGAAAITEVGAVRVVGGRRQGEFASLVNPGIPVPPGIEALTGITDWMLAAAPKLPAVLPGLLEFAEGCVLVAHNAPFDIGFLVAACGDCGLAWPGFTVLDTVMLARQVMDPDEVPDCKLGTLAGFFRSRTAPAHRALADARATADVLGWLIRRLAHRGIRTLSQLSAWPDVVAYAPAENLAETTWEASGGHCDRSGAGRYPAHSRGGRDDCPDP